MSQKDVVIDYTNWRGERRNRRIRPIRIIFGPTEWHDKVQWHVHARDLDLDADRYFAMDGIHSWRRLCDEDRERDTKVRKIERGPAEEG